MAASESNDKSGTPGKNRSIFIRRRQQEINKRPVKRNSEGCHMAQGVGVGGYRGVYMWSLDLHVIDAGGNHYCVCLKLMAFMMSFVSGAVHEFLIIKHILQSMLINTVSQRSS